MMEADLPRVGVFVCHCGKNIAETVDVKAVVEYSLSLAGVVYSEDNLYSCSSDGLNKLKDAIVKHGLNRVVVASCTPRTHEHLFQHACKEAGLNPYLFEMANIRDQCSWVHIHQPEEATKKAKDLVHMAVAKARLHEPQEEPEIEVRPETLVIGGGISGMTAAISLSNQGFRVHLVEEEEELGGMLLKLDRLFPTNMKSEELLRPRVRAIESDPNIVVHKSSRVRNVSGFIGNFEAEVNNAQGEVETLEIGTIIVATGAESYDPVGLYGFGEDSRIVTQLQFEELLKGGGLEDIRTVVMIQCVGSRNEDRPYCSRVCCSEAMKNAAIMMEPRPKSEVYILYRDLQTYGTSYTPLEWEAKKSLVKLVKYDAQRPPEVTPAEGAIHVRVYSPLLDEDMELEADLVVLSTPLIPRNDARELSQMLKVPLNPDGFFMEAHVKLRPLDFATDGIYVCGTAHSPKEIGESIAQALGAASRAAIPMARGKKRTAAIVSVVDEDKCSGCGTCVEVCPYNAIQKDETGIARVTAAVCKGCGVCGASCPERAITMQHFTNEQLEAQALAALGRVDD
jgi:heterodisulfide reductase subunit A